MGYSSPQGRTKPGFTARQRFTWGSTSLGESDFCLVAQKTRLGSSPQGLDWPIPGQNQKTSQLTEPSLASFVVFIVVNEHISVQMPVIVFMTAQAASV